MKITKGIKLAALSLALLLAGQESFAQIVVNVRPSRPRNVAVRPSRPPRAGYVWVEEDWTTRGGRYVYNGGRWVAPPRPRAVWVSGHWDRRRGGYVWIPGRWR